jgi:hypothetical protein
MRQARLMSLPDPEWVDLLKAEVAKPGASIASVAREIDMSRPSLSMLLAGSYPARIDKVSAKYGAKVMARYRSQVLCPHQKKGISVGECCAHASGPMPMNNHDELRQWAACQRCAQNTITPQTGDLK